MGRGRHTMRTLFTLLTLLCGAAAVPDVYGQGLTATIAGTVVDQSHAALPGATITITNVGTQAERTVVTDEEGRYRVTSLAPGEYAVRGVLMGFRTVVRSGIRLEMARTAAVDLLLEVGDVKEQVEVRGEAPLVNTTDGGMGEVIERQRIENLPLNGRSFQQLATLQPGVTIPAKMSEGSGGGKGMKIIASGTRANYTQFSMDGVDFNDVRNTTPASALGNVLGVEAVQEFKVMTNNYSAEFGRNAGAVVSIVTRSGTNRFGGSVYEFHRNDSLNANNFFDGEKPSFDRNQFGFLIEGPIFRDRTFFVLNYEGLRESLGVTRIGLTPDANARRGSIPGIAPFTVHPNIVPFLALWPEPNGPNFGNGVGEYRSSGNDDSHENFLTVRVDQKLSSRDNLYARYLWNKGVVENGHPLGTISETSSRTRNLVVEETHVFNSRWVNTLRFGYSNPEKGGVTPSVEGIPEGIPGRGTPRISVGGLTRTAGSSVDFDGQHSFQIFNDTQYVRGAHNLKFGFLFQNFRITRDDTPANFPGDWTFGSVVDLMTNNPEELNITNKEYKQLYRVRQSLVGMYVQDDWKIRPNLTMNFGVRYEFITAPTEADGEIATFLDPQHDAQPTIGNPLFENPSLKNVAPRLGFAWDPFGKGATSLRGGFGVFYQQVLPGTYLASLTKMPPFSAETGIDPDPGMFPFIPPSALTDPPNTTIDPAFVDYYLEQPTVLHFNLAGQHEVTNGMVVTLGYAGSRGMHLTSRTDTNIFPYITLENGRKFFPSGTTRINPNWRRFNHTVSDRMSFYHSLQAGLQRRFDGGLGFQAAYTFSKAIDEGSHETASNTFRSFSRTSPDPFDHTSNRGLADFDVRHSFVTNLIYQLPFGPGRRFGSNTSGVWGKLIEGWQLSAIAMLASGSPFEVIIGFDHARSGNPNSQRPDLVPGADARAVNVGNPNEYFDVGKFMLPPTRTLGNLGRNAMIGPGLVTVDGSLAKHVSLGGSRTLQLRLEVYNLGNRANFAVPSSTSDGVGGEKLFDSRGGRLPQAARIVATTTPARQIQLGVRVVF